MFQPAEGTPWMDFLNEHPAINALWNMLPAHIRTAIANKIGGKIVSFDIISTDLGGGSETVTFPEDFTGINGDPSTTQYGKYKVVFAFLSWENPNNPRCHYIELDFDCSSFFVIPEVTFGTITILLTFIIALPTFKLFKKNTYSKS